MVLFSRSFSFLVGGKGKTEMWLRFRWRDDSKHIIRMNMGKLIWMIWMVCRRWWCHSVNSHSTNLGDMSQVHQGFGLLYVRMPMKYLLSKAHKAFSEWWLNHPFETYAACCMLVKFDNFPKFRVKIKIIPWNFTIYYREHYPSAQMGYWGEISH